MRSFINCIFITDVGSDLLQGDLKPLVTDKNAWRDAITRGQIVSRRLARNCTQSIIFIILHDVVVTHGNSCLIFTPIGVTFHFQDRGGMA